MDISVIIPTYNRADKLPELLKSWEHVNRFSKLQYELIFSDDGSTDGTLAVLDACDTLPLVILRNEHGGASSARNFAVAAACGERILFMGDDIFPRQDILDIHVSRGKKYGDNVAVLGQVDWHPAQIRNHLLKHIVDIGNEQFSFNCLTPDSYADFRHFYTCNVSVSKRILDLEKIKFDPRFYKVNFEDVELAFRLSKHGMKILYIPGAFGHHYHEYDVEGFCRRQQTAGEMALVIRDIHPEIDFFLNTHVLEKTFAHYVEMSGDCISSTAKIHQVILRTIEYESEILNSQHSDIQKKRILSILYQRLFRLKFEQGVLYHDTARNKNAIDSFLYDKHFGWGYLNELVGFRKLGSEDVFRNEEYKTETARNRDLISISCTVSFAKLFATRRRLLSVSALRQYLNLLARPIVQYIEKTKIKRIERK